MAVIFLLLFFSFSSPSLLSCNVWKALRWMRKSFSPWMLGLVLWSYCRRNALLNEFRVLWNVLKLRFHSNRCSFFLNSFLLFFLLITRVRGRRRRIIPCTDDGGLNGRSRRTCRNSGVIVFVSSRQDEEDCGSVCYFLSSFQSWNALESTGNLIDFIYSRGFTLRFRWNRTWTRCSLLGYNARRTNRFPSRTLYFSSFFYTSWANRRGWRSRFDRFRLERLSYRLYIYKRIWSRNENVFILSSSCHIALPTSLVFVIIRLSWQIIIFSGFFERCHSDGFFCVCACVCVYTFTEYRCSCAVPFVRAVFRVHTVEFFRSLLEINVFLDD